MQMDRSVPALRMFTLDVMESRVHFATQYFDLAELWDTVTFIETLNANPQKYDWYDNDGLGF